MSKFKKGDIVYVKTSYGWVEVKIIKAKNNYYPEPGYPPPMMH